MGLHEKVSCWAEGVVAMTGLDAAAVFTRGLGDVVVLAVELGVVVVVLAEELVEDRETGNTWCEPS